MSEKDLFKIENSLLEKLKINNWNELKNISLKNYNKDNFTSDELRILRIKIDSDKNIAIEKKNELLNQIDNFLISKGKEVLEEVKKEINPLTKRVQSIKNLGTSLYKNLGPKEYEENVQKVSDIPITEEDLQPSQVPVTAKPLEEIKKEVEEQKNVPKKEKDDLFTSQELKEVPEDLPTSLSGISKEEQELELNTEAVDNLSGLKFIEKNGKELSREIQNIPKSERPIIIDFLNVFLDENLFIWRNYRQTLNISKEESYEIIKKTYIGKLLLKWGRTGEEILKDLEEGGDEKLDPAKIQKILKDYGLGNKLSGVIVSVIIGGIIAGTTYSELHKKDKKLKKIKKLRKKYNL